MRSSSVRDAGVGGLPLLLLLVFIYDRKSHTLYSYDTH